MTRQINSYDYLRVLAAFAVVLLHTAAPLLYQYNNINSAYWMTGNVYDSLVRWCVPVFFMLSGAFLLDPRKQETLADIFKKRILKVLIPFVFWSIIYFFYSVKFKSMPLDLTTFLRNLINNDIYYHLWFIYILLGLYLMVPILKIIVQHISYKLFTYLLIIWFISSPLIGLLDYLFDLQNYFDIPIGSYVGYFMLGYFLRTFTISKKVTVSIYFLATISLVITIFGTYFETIQNDGKFFGYFYGYLSPNTVIISVAIFIFFKNLQPYGTSKLIESISACSFGIYLIHAMIHDLITKQLGYSLFMFNPIISIPLFAIIIFIISYAITYVISKIPYLKKII